MSDVLRVTSAEPVIHGVLKIVWDDGYAGVIDLRPLIARGQAFSPLRDSDFFNRVQVEEFGHSIYWMHPDGYEIDLGADALRQDTEAQARLHETYAS